MANTHSHLTLSDRIYIEQALERRMKFKEIAVFIGKDPTTVSKEIRRHRVVKESGRKTALCENRSTCTKQHMCRQKYCNKLCGKCTLHYGLLELGLLLLHDFVLLKVFRHVGNLYSCQR